MWKYWSILEYLAIEYCWHSNFWNVIFLAKSTVFGIHFLEFISELGDVLADWLGLKMRLRWTLIPSLQLYRLWFDWGKVPTFSNYGSVPKSLYFFYIFTQSNLMKLEMSVAFGSRTLMMDEKVSILFLSPYATPEQKLEDPLFILSPFRVSVSTSGNPSGWWGGTCCWGGLGRGGSCGICWGFLSGRSLG